VLDVRGRYYPYCPATRDEPEEFSTFEIVSVSENDKDVTGEFAAREAELMNVILTEIEDA
jgi:hypothetical protein